MRPGVEESGGSPGGGRSRTEGSRALRPTPREGFFGTGVLAGFLHGSLLFGGGVALLQVLHSRPASLADALVLLAWCLLLYGAWSALAFALVHPLGRLLAWIRTAGKDSSAVRAPLALAAFLFHLVFWFFALNWGLTYAEVPFEVGGPAGMIGYLLLRTLGIAVATAFVGLALARLFRAARRRLGRRGWVAVAAAYLLWAVAVGGVTLGQARGAEAERGGEAPRAAMAPGAEGAAEPLRAAPEGGSDRAARKPGEAERRPGRAERTDPERTAAREDEGGAAAVGGDTENAPPPPGRAPDAADEPDRLAPEGSEVRFPVVLVAVDGADWQVIEPMLEAGELPVLARLVTEGASGYLGTIPDANSAVIWASVYTGTLPREHGILDFYRLRFAGMGEGVYPVHRTFLKELAGLLEPLGLARRSAIERGDVHEPLVWEVAAATGRTIGVVDGYYYSFPAPRLPPESFFLAYGSDRYVQRVDARRRGYAALAESALFAEPPALLDRVAPHLDKWEFDWQAAVLLELLTERPTPDLVNFYAHQPDAVQHWAWRFYEPERYVGVDPGEVAERGDEIPAFYRGLDRFLGQLRDRLPPEAVLVLLSDHGHSPTLLHTMDTQHRHGPPGIVVLHGGPIAPGVVLPEADVYDVFPTALHLLGLPVPEGGPGEVLVEAFEAPFRDRPVERVSSYDSVVEEAGFGGGLGTDDGARDAEELEILRSLGYAR